MNGIRFLFSANTRAHGLSHGTAILKYLLGNAQNGFPGNLSLKDLLSVPRTDNRDRLRGSSSLDHTAIDLIDLASLLHQHPPRRPMTATADSAFSLRASSLGKTVQNKLDKCPNRAFTRFIFSCDHRYALVGLDMEILDRSKFFNIKLYNLHLSSLLPTILLPSMAESPICKDSTARRRTSGSSCISFGSNALKNAPRKVMSWLSCLPSATGRV